MNNKNDFERNMIVSANIKSLDGSGQIKSVVMYFYHLNLRTFKYL